MNSGPQIRVHLNPENGTLCGKRVFADVTKVPRGAPPRLPGWVDLNQRCGHTSLVGHRGGSTVAVEHLRAPHAREPRRRGPAGLGGGWPCTEQISSRQCAAPGTSTTCAEGSLRQGSPSKRRRNTHIRGRTISLKKRLINTVRCGLKPVLHRYRPTGRHTPEGTWEQQKQNGCTKTHGAS